MSDPDFVIHAYTVDDAIRDGQLVPIFENRWPQLTGGRPLVASKAIAATFSLGALRDIWNDYVHWRRKVMPTLPEEEQMFERTYDDRRVWVIDDGATCTILFPEEY